MLDMGFDDIKAIAKRAPPKRQTLLFSATFPLGAKDIAATFMREPATVKVAGSKEAAASRIEQIAF